MSTKPQVVPPNTPAANQPQTIAPAQPKPADRVNRPAQVKEGSEPYDVTRVAEAWGFDIDAYVYQALLFTKRAGEPGADKIGDLEQARFYLDRRIDNLRNGRR